MNDIKVQQIKSDLLKCVHRKTFDCMTADASDGDIEAMCPNASIAGVEGHFSLHEITFNNEDIPSASTNIWEIYWCIVNFFFNFLPDNTLYL